MEISLDRVSAQNYHSLIDILTREEASMNSALYGRLMTLKEALHFVAESFMFTNHDSTSLQVVLADNEVAGFAGLKKFSFNQYEGLEIGFLLKEKYWGKGIATNISKKILSKANVTEDKVYATVRPDNTKSIRVLTKLGFTLVDTILYPDRGDRLLMILN